MKVVQIIPQFGLAGAEIMCENLSYELMKLGNEVLVISLYNYHSSITERLEKNNIKVIYLNKHLGIDFSIARKLYKILKKERPDVVHTHLAILKYVVPAAILAGVKTRIHTIHNEAQKESRGLDKKFNKLAFKYFNVIPVALSPKIQATIEREYQLNKDKIPIICNGINTQSYKPKLNYSVDGKFKILNIARFSEQKNHIGLLEAFRIFHSKYSNSILSIIGEGEKRGEIEEFIRKNKLADCVQLLGLKSEVANYLYETDIFVLASLYEGIPMTILEAMAAGVPIVSTEVGGVPDILTDNKNALLVETKPTGIANAFEKLYKNSVLREEIGRTALENSEKYSSAYMACQYLKVYRQQNFEEG